jgi:hypothetical protein
LFLVDALLALCVVDALCAVFPISTNGAANGKLASRIAEL